MRLAITAALVILVAGGIGTAFGQSSQLDVRTKTTPGDVLTNPASPAAHDPAVNPSAAGTQREWRGYGASGEGRTAPARIPRSTTARTSGR